MPNNIVILIIITKFDPKSIHVNIKKLKPYMFIEDITLQPILIKLSDLVIDGLVQTYKHEPLPVELEDF